MTHTNAELPLFKRVGYLRSSLRYSSEPLTPGSVDAQANPNAVRVCCSPFLTNRYNQTCSMSYPILAIRYN
jgi:hypothetical protein